MEDLVLLVVVVQVQLVEMHTLLIIQVEMVVQVLLLALQVLV